MQTGAIILSGGKGKRLGFKEKGLISFKGETLIVRKVRQLSDKFNQITVVTNKPHLYTELSDKINLIEDDEPYQGPLRALRCGLKAAKANMNFVCAVDMPFINYNLLEFYSKNCEGFDAVVGKIDDRVEPMFGFYSKGLVSTIESVLSESRAGLTELVGMCESHYLTEDEIKKFDPELLSFVNINTEGDMLSYLKR